MSLCLRVCAPSLSVNNQTGEVKSRTVRHWRHSFTGRVVRAEGLRELPPLSRQPGSGFPLGALSLTFPKGSI